MWLAVGMVGRDVVVVRGHSWRGWQMSKLAVRVVGIVGVVGSWQRCRDWQLVEMSWLAV